ncbi:uncharacterized protein LOC135488339 isoform X2 [Lineus longissimus]|uniref:uncharacterized protein LOC135488339 isoform X2 n=1 Tax=Lineus longissimus TaxID=88925 RepID=UPI002B4E568E
MTTKREMQQTGQFHQAMMMNEEAMLMNQALSAAANSEPEVIEEDDTRCILKELFADVQDKGFVLSKSWGELLCSLSKFQGKLMVTENSYVERERLIKQQEEKLKQQTQSWPEEVLQLKSALSRKEKTLVACQAELVHVNKMAELVDVEHNSTKDILEKVLREKSEVEDKCAQYEIDLNTMSQKLQASQEELEIKDQLVAKLEQQMVKEIAESMQEITSLKGLLESREELLEEEKKAHDETNIKLRQLQISYQAMRRTLNSSPQYVPQMPMMPYHDNTHMVSPQPRDEVAYYPTPGSSYTQLWRPVSMRSGGSYSGGPPAKVRRVVTSSSTTEEDDEDTHSTAPDSRDEGTCSNAVKLTPVGVKNETNTGFDEDESSNSGDDAHQPSTKRLSERGPKRFSPDTQTSKKKRGPKPGWKGVGKKNVHKKPGPKPKKSTDVDKKTIHVHKKPGPKPGYKKNLYAGKGNTSSKPVECGKCHKMQPSITALQIHMNKKHPSQRPYKCVKCGHRMKLYYQMKTHEKNCEG